MTAINWLQAGGVSLCLAVSSYVSIAIASAWALNDYHNMKPVVLFFIGAGVLILSTIALFVSFLGFLFSL